MMVVMAIFSLLVLALVSTQLFGLRMYRISETKLAGTAEGRKALNAIRDGIRQGKTVVIGNGSASGFTNIADNQPQLGNALQVYPTTNLNIFTRYYMDSADHELKVITSANLAPRVVARYVTNQLVFQAENFAGKVLTTDENNRVVRMTLEFYQWEYPIARIGDGGLYDYYRLQTKVTRRSFE